MSQDMFAQWREEDAANGNTVGQSVRPALEVAQDTTADAQAQNMQLAEQLGIPKEMVEEQSEWAKGEQKARQIEKNPLFAKWAEEDKTNAAFARDDTDAMSDVFEIMHEAELSAYGATGEQVKNDIVKGVLQYNAKRGDKEAQTQLMDMAGLTEDERQYGTISKTPMPGMLPQLGESFKEGVQNVGKGAVGALVMLGENLQKDLITGRETGWAPFWKGLAERGREALAYADQNNSAPLNAEGYLNDFVRNLPQVMFTIPVAAATGGVGGALFMGTNIAGQTYLDLTKKGISNSTAAISAFGNAAVQAPLEMLGLGKLFDVFKATGAGNLVKRVIESVATEWITETVQEHPDEFSRIWAEGTQRGDSWTDIWKTYLGRFGDITKQGMYSGLVAAPLGVLGGLGKFASDTRMARDARDWFVAQRAFHEKVEATKAKETAPVLIQGALEVGGMTQEVRIPAKEVIRLHQEGVPVLEAMGWEEADVQTEADRGGDMTAKMSRLHAYLDNESFQNVTQYARAADESWSMADAEEYDSRVKEDVDKLVAEQVNNDAEQEAISKEQARLEAELRQTVSSIPGLRAAIRGGQTLADLDPKNKESVDTVVAAQMKIINSIAQRLSSYGLPVSQFLSRIKLRGMMLDESGNLITPEQYEASGKGRVFQFLGERGAAALDAAQEANTRRDNLGVAREMENAGKDANAIKRATGWERGADGLWRHEVMDEVPNFANAGDSTTLGALFSENNETMAAYPELRDMPVKIEPLSADLHGYYDGEKIVLNSTISEEQRASTLLHEVQHAIQEKEGFARGGNPEEFSKGPLRKEAMALKDDLDRLMTGSVSSRLEEVIQYVSDPLWAKTMGDQINDILGKYGFNSWEDAKDFLTKENNRRTPFGQYRALSGEVEARNVQRRMEMDEEDRREFLASETEDVAREDQIILDARLTEATPEEKQEHLQETADAVLMNTVELNVESARDEASKAYMRDQMLKNGLTEKDADAFLAMIEGLAKKVMDVAQGNERLLQWNEQDVNSKKWRVNDITLGLVPTVSAFKKNGEYKVNFDFGTVCTKREAADALVKILVDMGYAQNMGPTQIEALKDLLKRRGFLTACDICFVETKRSRMLTDANKFSYEWRSLLLALGIDDGVTIGHDRTLTAKQDAILHEMAGDLTAAETEAVLADELAKKNATAKKPVTKLSAAQKRKAIEKAVFKKMEQSFSKEEQNAMRAAAAEGRTKEKEIKSAYQKAVKNAYMNRAFERYIPEERRRTKDEKGNDLDTGITASKMQMLATLMGQNSTLVNAFQPEWLLTTFGTDMLMRRYGPTTNMRSVLAAMFGAATAKPLEGFNIYDPLSWKAYDNPRMLEKFRKMLYTIGGARMQSFTDFNPVLVFDYIQLFADLQMRDLPLQMYTKVPALVELFGKCGIMMNMSLVAEVVEGVDKEHLGLRPDGKGGWEYAWASESFDVAKAMKYRRDPAFKGRVGTIAVGLSDAHIWMMLDDENIDMIIPYHKSGMPFSVQVKTGLDRANDYSDEQTTKKPAGVKDFSYNEALQRLKDPRAAAQEYLDWCDKHGYTPKFERFRGHKNYYKLLEDFRGYDNEGKAVIQGPVRLDLGKDFGEKLKTALGDRSQMEAKLRNLQNDEDLINEAKKILSKQRLDGDVRDQMMTALQTALGKDSVVSMRQNEFFHALEEAKAKSEGKEAAAAAVEKLRMTNGIVYGFAQGGKIVLNELVFNANTPAHEFTHIWAKVARAKNQKLWDEGKALLKQSEVWQEVLNDDLYSGIAGDEDAVASEVLARIVGRQNEEFVRSLVDPSYKMAKNSGLTAKIMEWVRKFFDEVRSLFSDVDGRPLTYEEFTKMPLRDLWDETRAKEFATHALPLLNQAPQSMAELMQDKQEVQAGQEETPATLYQRAFHGSPHRFVQFMLEHIGSGEGAQVHGWGLYFAQDRDVSEEYRGKLSRGWTYTVGDTTYSPRENGSSLVDQNGNKAPRYIFSALAHMHPNKSKSDAVAELREISSMLGASNEKQGQELHEQAAQWLEENDITVNKINGQLYEVEIPENDVLLDEQLPLNEQPKTVKDALSKLGIYDKKEEQAYLDKKDKLAQLRKKYRLIKNERIDLREEIELKYGRAPYEVMSFEEIMSIPDADLRKKYKSLQDEDDKYLYEIDALQQEIKNSVFGSGKNVYEFLTEKYGSPKSASLALNDAGIKGITYFGAEDGRCFVIFDDQAVQMIDIFYQLQQEDAEARGFVQIEQGQQYTIQLLKNANLSTLLHETGHIALLEMKSLMDMGVDNEALRADYKKIIDYLGISETDDLRDTTDPRMVQANEKFAKALELYLREGKAPSRDLESAFARIKRWLLSIYKQVIGDPYFNGVELNDDIRSVFDRLLATDEEIAAEAEKTGLSDSIKAELDALGLKGNERARITSLIQEAQEQAADNLQKARDAHRTAQLREWKAYADDQIKKEPQYIALSAMRKNGIDLEAVSLITGAEQARKLGARLPGAKKSGDVASPEEVAWGAGYATPEEMLADVLEYPTVNERRRQIIAQKQAEHDAQFSADDYLFEAEALAKSEEELGKTISKMLGKPRYQAELKGMTVNGEAVYPTEDEYFDYGRMAQYRVSQEKLKELAEASLLQTTMAKATNPEHFRRTVRKLIGEERRAIMRQDWQKALEANYQLRLNMELARLSSKMRKRMVKFTDKLRAFCKKPENAPAARYAVARLGMPLGLVAPTSFIARTAEGKTFNDIKQWASEVSEEYMDVQLNEGLYFVNAPGKNWRDMTVEGFQDWYNEMAMLMTVETERRKISTAQGKMELAELGKEMAASIYEHGGTPDTTKVQQQKPWLHALKSFHAEHLKAGTIAMLADGDRRGIVYEHLIKPIDKATYDEMNRMKDVDAKLKEIFDKRYSKDELSAMRQTRVLVQSLNGGKGEFITKENALAAFLNCGNESNYGRLMRGMEWNEEQLQDVLALLDERDFETAQMIWDYLESFRDESFALEERLTGAKPTAIKAQPVAAPSGKVYRGGYYPVKYNSQKASRGTSPEDRMQGQGRAFPSVGHGSMKERIGGGLGAPLDLRLNVLPEHLTKTVHNLAFREAVVNVSKILREPSFKQAFTETAGIEQYRALQSWLNDVASEQNQDMGAMGKAASWARSHMALYTMGMKISTMMAQLTGGLSTVVEIGPKWMATGTAKVFGHGKAGIVKAYQDALALSPMMQNRLTSFDREVAQSMNKLMDFGSTNKIVDPVKRIDNWIKSHAYLPMGYFQMAVDLPTWHGAYEKAMAENGGDPQAAAEYADHIVEITQVGGATKDLAGIQRHGELAKLFTMYYSYFSCLYNISARRITMAARYRDLPHIMRLAGLSMLWFVEPVMSAILLNRGPDDDEDWAEWAAKEAFVNPFSMIVGVRDIVKFEQDLLEGKNFGYRASPAFDLVSSLGKAAAVPIQTVFGDKEFDKTQMKKMAQGIGMASGTPLMGAQAITTLFNFWDVLDGTEELKLGDLLFTRRKNNSGGIWNRLGEAAGL